MESNWIRVNLYALEIARSPRETDVMANWYNWLSLSPPYRRVFSALLARVTFYYRPRVYGNSAFTSKPGGEMDSADDDGFALGMPEERKNRSLLYTRVCVCYNCTGLLRWNLIAHEARVN